jgi:hypothetical protein
LFCQCYCCCWYRCSAQQQIIEIAFIYWLTLFIFVLFFLVWFSSNCKYQWQFNHFSWECELESRW